MRVEVGWKQLQQSEGRNRCNPIEILWECSCTAGGIYKGNFYGGIERNRSLMPSRRFLVADLRGVFADARPRRGSRSVSAIICLVSMSCGRDRDLSRFRELLSPALPPLHHLLRMRSRGRASNWTLTRLLPDLYIFEGYERRFVLLDSWRPRNHLSHTLNYLNYTFTEKYFYTGVEKKIF